MKKLRYLFFISMMLFLVACSSSGKEEVKEVEEIKVPVEITKPERRNLKNTVEISGVAYASKDIAIISKLAGEVERIYVKNGDEVKKNQLLFEIDKSDLERNLKTAMASLNSAKASYNVTKEQYNTNLKNYNRNKENIEVRMKNTNDNYERNKKLYEEGAISKSDFESIEVAWKEQINNFESQLENLKLQISDSQLKLAAANINQAEISVSNLLESIENTKIKAPENGIIAFLTAEEGEFVSSAQPALRIIQDSSLCVKIQVDESVISKIKKDAEVEVSLESTGIKTKGTIKEISPSFDERTFLYPVEVILNNEEKEIKPGMFATVKISVEELENALTVPTNSIISRGEEKYLFTVEEEMAIERVVKTGVEENGYTEILEGVKESDTIILKGQNYVSNQTKIEVVGGDQQ